MLDVLVSYSYYEGSNPRYQENLMFFIKEGLDRFAPYHDDNVHTIFVIQDKVCSVPLPCKKNVTVIKTENTGFDLGAHGKALRSIAPRKFDHYVFLNSGQRGPFLPSYWPVKEHHWSQVYINRMSRHPKPGVVSSSMFMHPYIKKPIAETWAFAMPRAAMEDVINHTRVFELHKTKDDTVKNGEDTMSPYLFDKGYQLDTLLFKYRDTDWTKTITDKKNSTIPSRPWSYDSISIHPMEVVFYKTYWQSISPHIKKNGYVCPFEERYTQWALKYPKAKTILHLEPAEHMEQTDSSNMLVVPILVVAFLGVIIIIVLLLLGFL